MSKRKICVVTGTRAEYGLLRSVMKAIQNHPSLELQVVATGMHLSARYGNTINEILKDGLEVKGTVPLPSIEHSDSAAMARSVGEGVVGLSEVFTNLKPDVVMVLGDRAETLAAVTAAAYLNIAVAHIHGGDSAEAGLDENARHAITKLAHIHFPATQLSRNRILKMGEQKWRVFLSGAPGLDDIKGKEYPFKDYIADCYNLDLSRPSVLLVQHSVSTEPERSGFQIKETLDALLKLDYQTIALYPNSDAGGEAIIYEIERLHRTFPQKFRLFKSIPRRYYLGLLNTVSVLVGNSSSGIIEAASFRLPVVDIGTRQSGRECGNNVIHVPHEMESIVAGIQFALESKRFRSGLTKLENPYSYSYGSSGRRIAKVLAEIKLDEKLLKKKIAY